jgi:hypothetical protein
MKLKKHGPGIRVALTSIGVVAVMSVVGILTVGSSAAFGSAATTTSATTTVTVPGNQTWTDTGIALSAGEKVSISASGEVSMGPTWPATGPVGLKFSQGPSGGGCGGDQYDYEVSAPFPAPGVNCGSMLFEIGSSGVPFPTRTGITFHAPVAGELYLGVNDNNVSDNTGSWTATITTTSTSTSL